MPQVVDERLQVRFSATEYDWLGRLSVKLRAPRSAVVRAIVRDFQRRSEKAGKVSIDLGEVEVDFV